MGALFSASIARAMYLGCLDCWRAVRGMAIDCQVGYGRWVWAVMVGEILRCGIDAVRNYAAGVP